MKTRWLKWVGAISGAIIVGAIGSGVWAELLSPLLNMLINSIIKLFSSISVSFADSIYSEAAKGFHERPALRLFTLCLSLISGMYLGILYVFRRLRRRNETDKIGDLVGKFLRTKLSSITLTFIVVVVFIMFIFTSIQESYINKVITSSFNSIEIASPYIGIQKSLELRSAFHRIQTSNDYKDFYDKVKKLEKPFKLKLPIFEPL